MTCNLFSAPRVLQHVVCFARRTYPAHEQHASLHELPWSLFFLSSHFIRMHGSFDLECLQPPCRLLIRVLRRLRKLCANSSTVALCTIKKQPAD